MQFFISFLESTLIFEYFEKKMNLITKVFLKLLTPKDVVTETKKGPVSENTAVVNVFMSPKSC